MQGVILFYYYFLKQKEGVLYSSLPDKARKDPFFRSSAWQKPLDNDLHGKPAFVVRRLSGCMINPLSCARVARQKK
jgi:hypothetical protein